MQHSSSVATARLSRELRRSFGVGVFKTGGGERRAAGVRCALWRVG
jgi:hypothetical protein